MKKQQGFTLIELMIVVAIIAILAAIALPAYSDYTKKAKVSEVVLAASSLRTSVSEYVASNNELPDADWYDSDSFQATKYVSGLSVGANGVITATSQGIPGVGPSGADSGTITLTPNVTEASLAAGVVESWTCDGTIQAKFPPG